MQLRAGDEIRVHLERNGDAITQGPAQPACAMCLAVAGGSGDAVTTVRAPPSASCLASASRSGLRQRLEMLLDALDPSFRAKLHRHFGEQPPRKFGAEIESDAARLVERAFALCRERLARRLERAPAPRVRPGRGAPPPPPAPALPPPSARSRARLRCRPAPLRSAARSAFALSSAALASSYCRCTSALRASIMRSTGL